MLSARPTPAVAGSYFAGSLVGAVVPTSLLIILAGLVSPLPERVRASAVGVGLVLLALRAAGLLSYRLPQNARQIPEYVFSAPPRRAAFRFAFELGTAMRTYITADAPYAIVLTAALLLPRSLGAAVAAAALLAFGFAVGRSQVIVGQVIRSEVITRPGPVALQAANALAILGCAIVAVRVFVGS